MSRSVALLSTRPLPPAYFDTVREDLGDPNVTLDVISWVAPGGWVADKVNTFILTSPEAGAEPEAVLADGEAPPAPSEVTEAGPAPEPAPKPRPTGTKRVVKAVVWRSRKARDATARMLPKAIRMSVKFLRANRADKQLGKAYWDWILSRRDVMSTIEKADVVVALDSGAIWAGWNLGQRRASTPVVLGIPAVRRELDMLKGPAGHG